MEHKSMSNPTANPTQNPPRTLFPKKIFFWKKLIFYNFYKLTKRNLEEGEKIKKTEKKIFQHSTNKITNF